MFINYTRGSFLIKNSIPMGIEKKKIIISLPRPAPQVLPPLQAEALLHIVKVLLLKVEAALGEPAGVAGRREDQPCKCKLLS